MPAGVVSIRTGAKGPNSATCTACSTGAHAIGDAYLYIQHGYCDAAICGGTEAVIHPLTIAGFANIKALSTRNDEPEKASRPWDADRDGFVVGEGAGLLMLEELEHAETARCPDPVRGSRVRHERGTRTTSLRHLRTADGPARAMQMAVADAGLAAGGCRLRQRARHPRPRSTTGSRRWRSKRSSATTRTSWRSRSTKSATGHLLGAAGGLETGISARSSPATPSRRH